MTKPTQSFSEAAAQKPMGSGRQFLQFLFHNKKWWLTPIIVILLLLGALVLLGGTGVAPFIYSLF
jgi:hypothetical protein